MKNEGLIKDGEKFKFKFVKENILFLRHYIKTNVLELESIQAFCICDRAHGFLGLKRELTALVFYKDAIQYNADKDTMYEKMEHYCDTMNKGVKFIVLNIEKEASRVILQSMRASGFDIVEKGGVWDPITLNGR